MLLLLFSTLIHFFIQPFTIHRNNEDEKDALRLEMAAGRLREKEELNLEIKELKRKLESELEKRMRRKNNVLVEGDQRWGRVRRVGIRENKIK